MNFAFHDDLSEATPQSVTFADVHETFNSPNNRHMQLDPRSHHTTSCRTAPYNRTTSTPHDNMPLDRTTQLTLSRRTHSHAAHSLFANHHHHHHHHHHQTSPTTTTTTTLSSMRSSSSMPQLHPHHTPIRKAKPNRRGRDSGSLGDGGHSVGSGRHRQDHSPVRHPVGAEWRARHSGPGPGSVGSRSVDSYSHGYVGRWRLPPCPPPPCPPPPCPPSLNTMSTLQAQHIGREHGHASRKGAGSGPARHGYGA